MEWFQMITAFVDDNIIRGLPFTILILMVVRFFFKSDFDFTWIYKFIKWLIVAYAAIVILGGLLFGNAEPDYYSVPLFVVYLILFIRYIPFLLAATLVFFDKLSLRSWYLMLISLLFSFEIYVEIFGIVLSNFQLDFIPLANNLKSNVFAFESLLILSFQGLFIAILLLLGSKFKRSIRKE